MNKFFLSFVACPNHDTNEGFGKLYSIGKGKFKCSLCGKEFTREEVRKVIKQDYAYRIQDAQQYYQRNLASLYKDKQEKIDKLNGIEDET